jgi:hypothetical protein
MAIAELMRAGLTRLRGQLNSPTFTWKERAVPCVPNTLGIGSVVASGGYEMTIGLTLFVDREEFLSVDTTLHTVDSELMTVDDDRPTPVTGKTLVYVGATYRIARTTFSPCGTFIVLMLADKNA